jgi:hypothetical protein
MACFTAESDELRHDQKNNICVFMMTKIIKNLKYYLKINFFLNISIKWPYLCSERLKFSLRGYYS